MDDLNPFEELKAAWPEIHWEGGGWIAFGILGKKAVVARPFRKTVALFESKDVLDVPRSAASPERVTSGETISEAVFEMRRYLNDEKQILIEKAYSQKQAVYQDGQPTKILMMRYVYGDPEWYCLTALRPNFGDWTKTSDLELTR